MIREDGFKFCKSCEEWKLAAENYYKSSVPRSDGFLTYCKICEKARVVRYQKANKEKKAGYDQRTLANRSEEQKTHANRLKREATKRRKAADPVGVAQRNKANRDRYDQKHPGIRRLIGIAFRNRHPERSREHQRNHYWRNESRRQRCIDHSRLRNAFTREAIYQDNPIKLCRQDWYNILAAFDNKCCYCDSLDDLTIEHLTPLRREGTNDITNLAPACRPCNIKKGAKLLETFAPDRALEIRRIAFSIKSTIG